jgi:hypothetical protein
MTNSQTIINISKKYYDKHNSKFVFCESCYWFATILVEDKFNNIKQCYICNKKNIHNGTILI